jgi:hypothetical protein
VTEVRTKEQLRGWPAGSTAPTELTSRYHMMVRAVDEARSVGALVALRDEASAWMMAAENRNLQGVREASAVIDRALRKLAEIKQGSR